MPAKHAPDTNSNDAGADSLTQFSTLANGLACFMAAEAAMASSAIPEPSPALVDGWAFLTSPRGVVLAGLLQGRINSARRNFASTGNNAFKAAAGYPDESLPILAAAVRAAAADISRIAANPNFLKAAVKAAPMIVSASSPDKLSYPLMGLAIRPSHSVVDGARQPTLAGADLAIMGIDSKTGSVEALANLGAVSATDLAQAAAARNDLETAAELVGLPGLLHALPLSAGSAGRSSIFGDSPLPSCQALRQAISDARQAQAHPGDISKKVLSAPETAVHKTPRASALAARALQGSALDALSAGMAPAPSIAEALVLRRVKLSIAAGPHAQASTAGLIFQPGMSMAALLQTPRTVYAAMLSVARGIAPNSEPAADAIEELAGRSAKPMSELLQQPWATPAFLGHVFSLAFEAGGRSPTPEEQLLREAAPFLGDANEPRLMNWNSSFSPPTFPSGVGFKGLASTLAEADARLGVCQWAFKAFQALDWGPDGNTGPWGAHTSELYPPAGSKSRQFLSDSRAGGLVAALIEFSQALQAATLNFADAAVAAAEKTEAFWMAQAGFGDAWEQASALDVPTSASVRWAMANPQAESIASEDPMERLAGACARAFGIRAGTADLAVAELRAELAERGLDEAGFELLSSSGDLRDFLGKQAVGSAGQGRKAQEARLCSLALAATCKGIAAAARAGMDGAEAFRFVQILCAPEKLNVERVLEHDLSGSMRSAHVRTAAEAVAQARMARAKRDETPRLFDLLASDWLSSRLADKEFCVAEDASFARCRARLSGCIAALSQTQSGIQWTSGLFSSGSAAEVFRISSPRLFGILSSAASEGGLAAWCSSMSGPLGILDAADANDLVGQCKRNIKHGAGLSEAGWKSAIKSPAALALIAREWSAAGFVDSAGARSGSLGQAATKSQSSDDHDDDDFKAPVAAAHGATEKSLRSGACISFATAHGIAPDVAWTAMDVFSNQDFNVLLSRNIPSRSVDSPEAADFFAAEASAKERLMPWIFKEACRRYERLDALRSEAISRNAPDAPLPAGQALAEEISGLCDWIKGSEDGVWLNLPAQPTWGQLSRLSDAWHAEVVARAADEAAKEQIKAEALKEASKKAPFAPSSGSRWEPIVGAHSRDGWTAVELLTQAELSEEGSAMGHCVSSYSGVCRRGEKRIFSIRLNGERRCTMELSSSSKLSLHELGEDASLAITQNKGKHNASVTNAATLGFCQEVVVQAGAAWSEKWRLTQDFIRKEQARVALARKKAREVKPKATP